MTIFMLEEFIRRLTQDYRLSGVSIYGPAGGDFAPLAGSALPEPVLAEYRTYTTPKYIVREDGGGLLNAPGVKSRFVWYTTLNGQPFLVVLDSGKAAAFENVTGELLREIRVLKGRLEA